MLLQSSETFTHSCFKQPKKNHNDKDLQKMLMQVLQNVGISSDKVQFNENDVLEIGQIPNLKLHTLMLEIEKLGLEMKYTKKTMIEIC